MIFFHVLCSMLLDDETFCQNFAFNMYVTAFVEMLI
jgi:hypothetical protein